MAIVNLYRKQAMEVFPNLRFVKFKPRQDADPQPGQVWHHGLGDWFARQNQFSKELKQFLKELEISYAWTNSPSADYSSLITVVIVNPEDYSMIKLMSDEYEITNTYMLPMNLSSFSFRLSDKDYEQYKDAISQVKR